VGKSATKLTQFADKNAGYNNGKLLSYSYMPLAGDGTYKYFPLEKLVTCDQDQGSLKVDAYSLDFNNDHPHTITLFFFKPPFSDSPANRQIIWISNLSFVPFAF
jgi:hypothetical protein